jgi:hypothetical protein
MSFHAKYLAYQCGCKYVLWRAVYNQFPFVEYQHAVKAIGGAYVVKAH